MAPSVVSMSTLYVLSLRAEEDLVDADGYVPGDQALRPDGSDRGWLGSEEPGKLALSLTGFSLRLMAYYSLLRWWW